MKKQKRPLTLMEVIIAFTLASFVIGALLFSLKSHVLVRAKSEKAESDIMQRGAMQQRLDALLFSLTSPQQNSPKEHLKTPMYLKNEKDKPTLHFFFNNGVDPQPDFCGEVEGILDLKKDQTFCLTLKSRESAATRKEVLLRNVQAVNYAFLSQDDQGGFTAKKVWEEKEPEPPFALKLTAKFAAKKDLDFVFWLPIYCKPFVYSEKT